MSRVRSDGALVDATALAVPYYSQFNPLLDPAVSWDGDQFQVLFVAGDGIYGFDVSATGVITGPIRVTVGQPDAHPTIASAGGRSVVAYDTSQSAGESGVYLSALDADGTPVAGALDMATPVSLTGREPSLASNGVEHVVVWQETRDDGGDIYAARVSQNGVLLSAPVAVASGAGVQGSPAVTWSGGKWSIAFTRQDPVGGRDVGLAEISFGTVPAVVYADVATGSGDQHSPSVAFDATKVTVGWISGSTAFLRQATPSGANPLTVDASTVLVSNRIDAAAATYGRATAISAGASRVIQIAYVRADGLFTRQLRLA